MRALTKINEIGKLDHKTGLVARALTEARRLQCKELHRLEETIKLELHFHPLHSALEGNLIRLPNPIKKEVP